MVVCLVLWLILGLFLIGEGEYFGLGKIGLDILHILVFKRGGLAHPSFDRSCVLFFLYILPEVFFENFESETAMSAISIIQSITNTNVFESKFFVYRYIRLLGLYLEFILYSYRVRRKKLNVITIYPYAIILSISTLEMNYGNCIGPYLY